MYTNEYAFLYILIYLTCQCFNFICAYTLKEKIINHSVQLNKFLQTKHTCKTSIQVKKQNCSRITEPLFIHLPFSTYFPGITTILLFKYYLFISWFLNFAKFESVNMQFFCLIMLFVMWYLKYYVCSFIFLIFLNVILYGNYQLLLLLYNISSCKFIGCRICVF